MQFANNKFKFFIVVVIGLVIITYIPWRQQVFLQHHLSDKKSLRNLTSIVQVSSKLNVTLSTFSVKHSRTWTKSKSIIISTTNRETQGKMENKEYTGNQEEIFIKYNKYNKKQSEVKTTTKLDYLQENRTEDIPQRKKTHILLAVGIMSKLSAISRRNAIRNTWFHICREKPSEVSCIFFTDEIRSNTENKEIFIKEKRENTDLEYMPYRGGYNFALRLIWMLKWFAENNEFDYFLRLDDDYFICLDRLLKELPYRPNNSLYWGWVHCEPGRVRVDEGFMILSRDIVSEILGKVNTTLLCHPYGGQAVGQWISESRLNIIYFMDNNRLIHEVTSYMGNRYLVPNLCNKYLGLHGTYPIYMYKYWHLFNDRRNILKYGRNYTVPPIVPFRKLCRWKTFHFDRFGKPFHAIPRPCKDNPVFVSTDKEHRGRERT